MSAPRVSVILPTYNRAHLLPRAIASVLDQSFADLELIVVDDASTDDTAEVVQRIGDPRLVYARQPRNGGDAPTRNAGVRRARGELLAFQDSDDEWLPGKLEQQVAKLDALGPDCGMVACTVRRVIGDAVTRIDWPREPGAAGWIDRHVHWTGRQAYLQSILVRRTCFDAVGGFDEDLPLYSDGVFCARLLGVTRAATLDEELVVSYETPGSISQHIDKRVKGMEIVVTRYADAFGEGSLAMGAHRHQLALDYVQLGNAGAARRHAWRAVRADPRRWRYWALLVLTLAGSGTAGRVLRWRQSRSRQPV